MTSFVQLISEWKPQETTISFDISKIKNYYRNVKKIELASILFCEEEQHLHFDSAKKTSEYPIQENYQEKISIAVPRPQVIVHRRKTMYFLSDLKLETDLSEITETAILHRIKRHTESDSNNITNKRVKRNVIGASDVVVSLGFSKPLIKSSIIDPASIFIDNLIFRIESHFQKANEKFNNILLGKFSILLTIDNSDDAKAHITITLPAKTMLYIECPQFFNALGFEHQLSKISDKYYGFKNNSKLQMEIIGNPINIATLTLLYVAYQQSIGLLESIIYPPSSLTFYFYTLNKAYEHFLIYKPDSTSKATKIASLENALIFFQKLIENLFEESRGFILDRKAVETWVHINAKKSKISLWMLPSTAKNFEMSIKLGSNIKIFLNTDSDIDWSTTHKIDVTGILEKKAKCTLLPNNPCTNDPLEILNSSNSEISHTDDTIDPFKKSNLVVHDSDVAIESPSSEPNVNIDNIDPPQVPTVQLPPLVPIDPPQVPPIVPIDPTQVPPLVPNDPAEVPPIVPIDPPQVPPIVPIDPTQVPPIDPAQIPPLVPNDPAQVPPLVPIDPAQVPPIIPIDPPEVPPIIPFDNIDPYIQNPRTDDDDELFDIIEIDNPVPKESNSFIEFEPHYNPHKLLNVKDLFPSHSVLIINEGQNNDYIPSYGVCTIAGFCTNKLLSKSNSFKIDWSSTNTLSFQMIDRHLKIFTPKKSQFVSFFLKIDV